MTAPSTSAEITKALAADRRVTHAILEVAIDQLAHHPGQVAELLRDRVQLNESGYVVSNVAALVDQLRAASPYMFRDRQEGQDADQAKAKSTAAPAPESDEELRKIFGPGSSSKLANQLGTTNPRLYSQLREAAVKAGIL